MQSRLYVFNLVTGAVRTWSHKDCSHCLPAGGGLTFSDEAGSSGLSWTANGRHVAFVGPGGGQVWLLDTIAPGSDLLTRSKPVAGQQGNSMEIFHGGTYTPIPWDRHMVTAIRQPARLQWPP
jgi:hypothetical protein